MTKQEIEREMVQVQNWYDKKSAELKRQYIELMRLEKEKQSHTMKHEIDFYINIFKYLLQLKETYCNKGNGEYSCDGCKFVVENDFICKKIGLWTNSMSLLDKQKRRLKMERLTKYDNSAKCYLPFSLTDWDEIKIMNKLGELEDVLETYCIEDLDKFIDNQLDEIYKLKQELAELKQKAVVLEKAFELACDPRDDWGGKEYSGTEFNNYHDYFIAEAQKELGEIGGKDE